jgi:hypothetical protein
MEAPVRNQLVKHGHRGGRGGAPDQASAGQAMFFVLPHTKI